MSVDDDNDLASLAYPGFVDILSSVIIMFVFFVLVIASALYFYMIIFKSQILATINEANAAIEDSESKNDVQQLMFENQALKKEIEEVTKKMETFIEEETEDRNKLFQERSEFTESDEQETREEANGNSIVVFFGTDSISLTEDSKATISNFLAKHDLSRESVKIRLTAGKNPNALTEATAQKLSLARMLNVRNMFLETDISPKAIIPRIAGDEMIDDSTHWVRIEVVNE